MDERHHRRDFVRTLALGASAGVLATSPGIAADDEKKDEKPKVEPEKPKSEADARMEIVLARFGKQLDEGSRKSVRAEIEMITRRAEALRKFKLENGDEPFPVFTPYRAPLA